ncbi:MAG TPA: histidine phosphatase family protein [Polyangiaceae bacterium]|nr:histidine phosphatase family protein [Polyangiaceae bacterium]
MTSILLVRHGNTEAVGEFLVSRLPGYPLDERGRAEAESLATALSPLKLTAVHSSPLQRAKQTATAIAAPHGIAVFESEALTDVDFGQWNGLAIADLEADAAFRRFNQHRALCAIPKGERVSRIQARMVDALAEIVQAHPDGIVVVVSHGDPIRLAVAFYLGLAVDHCQRLEIGTGSVTALELNDTDAKLLTLNASNADVLGR